MGRSSATKTPIERKTSLFATEYRVPYIGAPGTLALDYTEARLVSATASKTVMALQGPGVINFLHIGNAEGYGTKLNVFVDNELAFSASNSSAVTGYVWHIVGGSQATWPILDRVVFYDKFLVMAESNAPTQPTIQVTTAWSLTSG